VREVFIVRHFAEPVSYRVGRFLAKNADQMPADLTARLHALSSSALLRELYAVPPPDTPVAAVGAKGGAHKKKKHDSVGGKFAIQMRMLDRCLRGTDAHFIRCVKPNAAMVPGVLDRRYVVEQLRWMGVVQTCEILKVGLPTRLPYSQIDDLYRPRLPPNTAHLFRHQDGRALVAAALWAHGWDADPAHRKYRLGRTKAFFESGQMERLEQLLRIDLAGSSDGERILQRMNKWILRWHWRRAFAKVACHNAWIALLLRIRSRNGAAVKVQSAVRMLRGKVLVRHKRKVRRRWRVAFRFCQIQRWFLHDFLLIHEARVMREAAEQAAKAQAMVEEKEAEKARKLVEREMTSVSNKFKSKLGMGKKQEAKKREAAIASEVVMEARVALASSLLEVTQMVVSRWMNLPLVVAWEQWALFTEEAADEELFGAAANAVCINCGFVCATTFCGDCGRHMDPEQAAAADEEAAAAAAAAAALVMVEAQGNEEGGQEEKKDEEKEEKEEKEGGEAGEGGVGIDKKGDADDHDDDDDDDDEGEGEGEEVLSLSPSPSTPRKSVTFVGNAASSEGVTLLAALGPEELLAAVLELVEIHLPDTDSRMRLLRRLKERPSILEHEAYAAIDAFADSLTSSDDGSAPKPRVRSASSWRAKKRGSGRRSGGGDSGSSKSRGVSRMDRASVYAPLAYAGSKSNKGVKGERGGGHRERAATTMMSRGTMARSTSDHGRKQNERERAMSRAPTGQRLPQLEHHRSAGNIKEGSGGGHRDPRAKTRVAGSLMPARSGSSFRNTIRAGSVRGSTWGAQMEQAGHRRCQMENCGNTATEGLARKFCVRHYAEMRKEWSSMDKTKITLQNQVALLERQLQAQGVQPVAEYMELDEARAKLTEAVQRLMAGDMKAEADLERLDQLIKIHPDYIKEEEEKQKAWEAKEGPKCDEARNAIRGVVPVDVFSLTQTQLVEKEVPQEIARRIFTKRVLWFVRMDPEDISKLHAADLNTKYGNQGLDIVEMRAVYVCLPVDFQLDGDGKKAEWKFNFKQKLMELTRKEENNQLKKHEKRHASYVKYPNVKLFDTDKLRQKVEVQKGEAFAPQKASARPSIMAVHNPFLAATKEKRKISMMPQKTGYLMRKVLHSGGSKGKWKKQYFVVKDGGVLMFATEVDYKELHAETQQQRKRLSSVGLTDKRVTGMYTFHSRAAVRGTVLADKHAHAFEVFVAAHGAVAFTSGGEATIVLSANSEDEKEDWMGAMSSAAQASKVNVTSGDDGANPLFKLRAESSAAGKTGGGGGMLVASISETDGS
jgi:hypothetical protein